jgi:hypothetical protein
VKQRSPFKNNFSPSRRHNLHTGPVYLAIRSSLLFDSFIKRAASWEDGIHYAALVFYQ